MLERTQEEMDRLLENRLRRKLQRQGYKLCKSHSRTPEDVNYGGYLIEDASTKCLVAGGGGFDYSLDLEDVENFANEEVNQIRLKVNQGLQLSSKEKTVLTFAARDSKINFPFLIKASGMDVEKTMEFFAKRNKRID